MPALLTSASIDWKRDNAVSTILAAVAGSPMWPSTRATRSEAATSVDWVTFREVATTLKPRATNPCTIPAPIPCEAPVTMAVFRWLLMVGYLESALLLDNTQHRHQRREWACVCHCLAETLLTELALAPRERCHVAAVPGGEFH